jgi:hypothetical protein
VAAAEAAVVVVQAAVALVLVVQLPLHLLPAAAVWQGL